jgi:putative Holliday junction resolvase
MRSLAIDPGAKRVGLALSDAGGKLASPYEVLEVTTPAQTLQEILKIVKEEQVQQIVIGLPLNMDGSSGQAANQSKQLGQQLAEKTKLPIHYIDERLTSFQADENLRQRKQSGERLTRKKKKSRQDAHAAAIILQDFLDQKLPPH